MKSKEISKKNYLILFLMVVAVVIITLFIFDINNSYKNNNESNLFNYVNKVSLNDMENILQEPSSELFVFITETGNEDVYKLENNLKKLIKKYNLRDNFIYTDQLNDLNTLNETLESNIKRIPSLLYFRNGILEKAIESDIDDFSKDFEKLLKDYEVE